MVTDMVDETVFGGGFLGLEGTEQSLLSSEDLNRGGGVLGEVEERACAGSGEGRMKRRAGGEGRSR